MLRLMDHYNRALGVVASRRALGARCCADQRGRGRCAALLLAPQGRRVGSVPPIEGGTTGLRRPAGAGNCAGIARARPRACREKPKTGGCAQDQGLRGPRAPLIAGEAAECLYHVTQSGAPRAARGGMPPPAAAPTCIAAAAELPPCRAAPLPCETRRARALTRSQRLCARAPPAPAPAGWAALRARCPPAPGGPGAAGTSRCAPPARRGGARRAARGAWALGRGAGRLCARLHSRGCARARARTRAPRRRRRPQRRPHLLLRHAAALLQLAHAVAHGVQQQHARRVAGGREAAHLIRV